jgi:hypothetical protein
LFDPLSFALDAYHNGSTNTEAVTHVKAQVVTKTFQTVPTNLKCNASGAI